MNLNLDSATNELLNYWKHLSSLREPVRELVLQNWDETGRPRTDAPVRALLIGLCELSMENGGTFEAFKADAAAALRGELAIEPTVLEDYYVLFAAGAIYGTNSIRDALRREFASLPSNNRS